jgi:hypothetical protein
MKNKNKERKVIRSYKPSKRNGNQPEVKRMYVHRLKETFFKLSKLFFHAYNSSFYTWNHDFLAHGVQASLNGNPRGDQE